MIGFSYIIGEKLNAITFILDYYQFHFDGPTFDVLTSVSVVSPSGRVSSGDDRFRNVVCDQIGKVVSSVCLRLGEAITITFVDGWEILFSLKDEDYPGPEGVIFRGDNNVWGVF
jgi:hypothetical protein